MSCAAKTSVSHETSCLCSRRPIRTAIVSRSAAKTSRFVSSLFEHIENELHQPRILPAQQRFLQCRPRLHRRNIYALTMDTWRQSRRESQILLVHIFSYLLTYIRFTRHSGAERYSCVQAPVPDHLQRAMQMMHAQASHVRPYPGLPMRHPPRPEALQVSAYRHGHGDS